MPAPAPDALLSALERLPGVASVLARLDLRPPVYAVGGVIRDLLLGGRPLDLDLAVEGDAIAVARRLGGAVRTHPRFGTATVWLDGHVIDLASTRRERYERPGALPAVEPASLEEDLARRDFTVNALAVPLAGPHAGALLTAPGGLEDLTARRLRVLHARSFIDDPTRLFRLCRYAARLRFAVAPDTEGLARAALAEGAVATVSGDRVGRELTLVAAEPRVLDAFAAMHRLGLDAAVHAKFGLDPRTAGAALGLLPPDGRRELLVLALAIRALEESEARGLLAHLGIRGTDAETILAAAYGSRGLTRSLTEVRSPAEVAAAVGPAPVEAVALAGALGPAAVAREWLATGRHVTLTISGEELVAAGVPRGPAVGRGLRAALAAKRDGRAPSREAELAAALAAAGRETA